MGHEQVWEGEGGRRSIFLNVNEAGRDTGMEVGVPDKGMLAVLEKGDRGGVE